MILGPDSKAHDLNINREGYKHPILGKKWPNFK